MTRLSPFLLFFAITLTGCAEMSTLLDQAGIPSPTYTTGSRCTSNTTFQCARRVGVGSSVTGWVEPSMRGDRALVYAFHVASPGSYRVAISPVPNGFTTGFEIYDASYQRVTRRSIQQGRPEVVGLNVMRPGTYYVKYYSRSYARRPGERFVLSVGR